MRKDKSDKNDCKRLYIINIQMTWNIYRIWAAQRDIISSKYNTTFIHPSTAEERLKYGSSYPLARQLSRPDDLLWFSASEQEKSYIVHLLCCRTFLLPDTHLISILNTWPRLLPITQSFPYNHGAILSDTGQPPRFILAILNLDLGRRLGVWAFEDFDPFCFVKKGSAGIWGRVKGHEKDEKWEGGEETVKGKEWQDWRCTILNALSIFPSRSNFRMLASPSR